MFTNKNNIDVTMAVFLAHDDYDGVTTGNMISVTSLLKPLREIILGMRHKPTGSTDVSSLIASKVGTAIHTGIEHAWLSKPEETLKALGYPQGVYESLRVNPTEVDDDYLNVFLEQRAFKELAGFTINGKYDFIFDGQVQDVKTTGVYSWINKTNTLKYRLQGSLYRWLNPDKATADDMKIHFVFTDWSKLEFIKNPKTYPPLRVLTETYPLLTPQETHAWLVERLRSIQMLQNTPEPDLPRCTPEELWQGKPVYKYYKDPMNTKRSQGNFDTPELAYRKLAESGGMGVVIPVYPAPKACLWCSALPVCSQGQGYLASGQIKME